MSIRLPFVRQHSWYQLVKSIAGNHDPRNYEKNIDGEMKTEPINIETDRETNIATRAGSSKRGI